MPTKDTFYSLLRESVLVQATVTLILIGVMGYMYIAGREVPNDFVNIAMLVVGFWFGSKSQAAVERTVNNLATSNRTDIDC